MAANISSVVLGHPALAKHGLIGKPGFSLPDIGDATALDLNEQSITQLEQLGIYLQGGFGNGNTFFVDLGMPKIDLKVSLHRRHNNVIVLAKYPRLRGHIDMQGDNNIFVAGSAYADIGVTATFRYHQAGLFLGNGGSSPHNQYWIEGPNRSIVIGDDFLFSWGIWIRTADSHAMISLDTGEIMNVPKDVIIGPHVWLGQDVMVMPGARIEGGAIIGARSVVTKAVPPCCVAVGTPARVVRTNATWTRLAHPDPAGVKAVRELCEDIKTRYNRRDSTD